MTLTPEQIAEIFFPDLPFDQYTTDPQFGIKSKVRKQNKKHLISLIQDLQKETWDQACKAMKEKIDNEIGGYEERELGKIEKLIEPIESPPFNPEK